MHDLAGLQERKEKKRKEKTTPFGVNLMRSPVIYQAAQGWPAMYITACACHACCRSCHIQITLTPLVCITPPSVAICHAESSHQLVCNNDQLMQAVGVANSWFAGIHHGFWCQDLTCCAAAACCCLVSWRRAVAWAAAMRRMEVMLAAFRASIPSFSFFFSKISALCCSSSSCAIQCTVISYDL